MTRRHIFVYLYVSPRRHGSSVWEGEISQDPVYFIGKVLQESKVCYQKGEKTYLPCNNDKKVKALFPYAPHCGKDKLSHLNDTLQAILSGKNDKISLRILWIRHFIYNKERDKSLSASQFHQIDYGWWDKRITQIDSARR